jgi:hypothetical protein
MSQTSKITVRSDVHAFPLIVSFPQGVPENSEDMQINVFKKSSKNTRTQIISKINGLTFKGSDYGEYSLKKDGYKYAVGVHNVKTNQIKLLQTDHIFTLKAELNFGEAPVRNSTMSYGQRKQSLTEEFGSRKKKSALKAAQSNIISTDNISGVNTLESSLTLNPGDNVELIKAAEVIVKNMNKKSKRG